MPLSVTASRWISSCESGSGSCPGRAPPVISSAPVRSASTGRSVRPITRQATVASATSSSGKAISRMLRSSRTLCVRSAIDLATSTVSGPAVAATTRTGPRRPGRSPSM
jgi:hypothetical protein